MLKRIVRRNFLLLTILCISTSVLSQEPQKKPKNIILLIGDGMGLSEISSSLYFNDNPSSFLRFNTVGLSMTSSSKELITDSAAGATAFASGIKTYNGAIGVDEQMNPVETLVELISKKGVVTGLVSTSSVVHATPAAFYAHQESRRMYDAIAEDLVKSDIDFFAGGGLQYFQNRADGKNLIKALRDRNFQVETEKLPQKISEKKQAILLAADGMPKMSENRGNFLTNATMLAIGQLSKNPEGFFLMVEGSQIDWGGHANDGEYLINELIDFDKTIGAVLDFAEKNGETLVIVTADHETGGFSLSANEGNYNKIIASFSTTGHTATMVPVFAQGPGEGHFGGIYQNTNIFFLMKRLFNRN
ncbi:MAG TPA: alkaline phosphatase [Flavobacteriaceae bacterium]|nr:alkaline phosphatase [Flavobacteriaceae bacterium]HIB49216.1 alkaline phosphatase [Flavobacteriaceae bacterium]HIO00200.1 alkaline phosphatase [Flavobacteriaceae bacterium]